MSNQTLRLLILCGLIKFVALTAGADPAHFSFFVFGGTARITDYSGPGGHVLIPEELGGVPVGEIAFLAFQDNTNITHLIFPESLTAIAWGAFENCTALAEIILPDSLVSLGSSAFGNCTSLQRVVIGPNLDTIAADAFRGASLLVGFEVNPENQSFTDIDGVLFSKDLTTLKIYPHGREGPHLIPESTIAIGDRAFEEFPGITNAVIPATVLEIGALAFAGCINLEMVEIGADTVEIADGAFSACPQLTTITVHETNPAFSSIDGILFSKDGTWLIQYPGARGGPVPANLEGIGSHAFYGNTNLIHAILDDGLLHIGNSAFSGCNRLETLVLPHGLQTIGDHAFAGCNSLTTVLIPDSVTSMGAYAFTYCSNLSHVQLGTGLVRIPRGAFFRAGLEQLVIPDTVTHIADYAFLGNRQLDDLVLGSSLMEIGAYSFYIVGASVVIPPSVTRITQRAFSGRENDFYFEGDAPEYVMTASGPGGISGFHSRIYYLPDAEGWIPWWPGWAMPHDQHQTSIWLPRANNLRHHASDGKLSIDIHWAAGHEVEVEYSTNLGDPDPDWHSIASVMIGPDRTAEFQPPGGTEATMKVYRLRAP